MLHWPRSPSFTGRTASTRRHNDYSIELEVKIATLPPGAPYASKSTGKEGSYSANWSRHQGDIRLLLHNGVKEENVWNTCDPLGNLSVTVLCDQSHWKTTTTQARQDYQWPRPSGIKVSVTPPDKAPPAETLAEGKGNTEWVVKAVSYKYQL